MSYLIFASYGATLPKLNESGRCEPCGEKTCLVCGSISTAMAFTTEACQETFKIQSGPLTWDSITVLTPVSCYYMTSFNYGGKKARDAGHTCRCHLNNIMLDSTYYDSIGWGMSQFVFFP